MKELRIEDCGSRICGHRPASVFTSVPADFRGELVAAEASPKGYVELARASIQPAEDCPVPPALANGKLYCRTGKGALVCLDAGVSGVK